jgi:hypothetical protein
MNLDVRGVFRDAWSMWRRDRGVLVAIAGCFLFLPQLAYRLFGPESAALAAIDATGKLGADAQFKAVMQVYANDLPLLLAIAIATVFGALAILMLYLDGAKRDVGAMLLACLRRLPAYFVLTVVVDIAASAGVHVIYILLPCMYLVGRLLLAGPIFVQAGVGPIDAMIGSFRMTRGRGLVLAGFATLIIFAGLLPLPVIALGEVLDRAPLANPVSGLIIDAIAAAIAAAAMLGGILVRIALYRRIGASNGI